MANRLAAETSPYLLQHKDNPIDWWPWCDEAWELARSQNKPVFLSIGYSSCHWCHVMAHESFEDETVADGINRHFISIKLDREERPDIDEIYMTAIQLATGHGGWPMTLFLTPDKKPFHAGTYYPREPRGDFPGFLTLATSLAQAWNEQQQQVRQVADEFAEALSQALQRSIPPISTRLEPGFLDQGLQALIKDFDSEEGGFGSRPKFPPHSAIRYGLLYAGLRANLPGLSQNLEKNTASAAHMALFTLEKMAQGGIHDHVGGGFHRYSTDEKWLLPHFEKMLYDNGQLLQAYGLAAKILDDEILADQMRATAQGIVTWLKREMLLEGGLFASALDADTSGEEGLTYVWSLSELQEILGERAPDFCKAYGIEEKGNYLDESSHRLTGLNILHKVGDGDFPAELATLLAVRNQRQQPQRDDKALAAWNGLMMMGLMEVGEIELAETCAKRWLAESSEFLPHQISYGKASGVGFLDDYAFFVNALLDLAEALDSETYYMDAIRLGNQMVDLFADRERGGFFFTSPSHEQLFGRTKPTLDNATPSPNGAALRVLRRLGREQEVLQHLAPALGWAQRVPTATESIYSECLYLLLEAQEGVVESVEPAPLETQFVVSLSPKEILVDKEGWGKAFVTIEVPEGFHINSHEPAAEWLVPTSLRVDGVWGEAGFPSDTEVFKGKVQIPVRLRAKVGDDPFEIIVRFQPCNESECLLPQEHSLSGLLKSRQG
ncbi:MAG: DUF255 domain-containing protein [Fimbriimonadaceae bacterium]|nr:DUF255 domain-containing protein [Fimbriimonadaceae bacterium]